MTETTGTEIIRRMMIAKNHKLNIASMARDAGTSPQSLESFMAGRGTLPSAVLSELAKIIWAGCATYNVEQDKMESVTPASQPLGTAPDPYVTAPGYKPDIWQAGRD